MKGATCDGRNNPHPTFPQTKPNVPCAIPKRYQPPHAILLKRNRRGGACVPARTSSGVSIPKIHALCAGNERWMRPYGATRAGTQEPPLPISIIFFHAPHTNKRTIYMQSAQRKPTVHVQSAPTHLHQITRCAPTHLHQTTRCAHTPSGLYFR